MSPKLAQHLAGFVQPPGSVAFGIEVMLGTVINPAPATRYDIAFSNLLEFLFCLGYFFEVARVFFLVDIVGVFVDGEGKEGGSGESAP